MSVGPDLLATHNINGRPVRFFRPPVDEPDFPWFSYDDLMLAMGLGRQPRRLIARDLRNNWGDQITTAMCGGSITTVAPHFMAQGLLEALVSAGHADPSLLAEYQEAGAEALKELTGHLSPAELMPWVAEALRRNDVGGPS